MAKLLRIPARLRNLLRAEKKDSEIVWFVSFPKSGRTWMQLMTSYVSSELSGIDIRSFLKEHPFTYQHQVTKQHLPFVAFSHGRNNFELCKGHYFPSDFYQRKRLVLLVRDPRDVVISHYYYQKWHYEVYDGTLSEFIRYPYQTANDTSARYGIAPIVNYMNTWIKNRSVLQDLHIVQYEEIKVNPRIHLQKLYDYVGLPVTSELLESTVNYGSFENMRQLELSNELDWYGLGGAKSRKGFKTRQGKSGNYRQELSDDDLTFINNYIDTYLHPNFSYYYSNSVNMKG